ncbi:MAG: LLM class flavin-dependent oxidoreductase [Acidobacteriota bacterium]
MKYSVLDIFRNPLETAELVQKADSLGFHRYWIGEHHNPSQCANPVLLSAVLLGLTERIRIGTGAVDVQSRSPLSLADDGRMIRLLYGDRFDLGVSRSLVGAGPAAESNDRLRALLLDGRDPVQMRETVGDRLRALRELLSLEGRLRFPFWLVGSSAASARSAATLGVGFCTSLYHAASIPLLESAIAIYRDEFRGTGGLERPIVILAQCGVCAETREQALQALRVFFEAEGDDPATFTPKPMAPWLFAGTGEQCRETIEAAAARFAPDEVMVHNLLPTSLAAERRSLELLGAALELPRVAAPSAA